MITDYNQLTIKDFQELKAIELESFELTIEKEIAVLSILTGFDRDELERCPKSELMELTKQTAFFSQPVPEVLMKTFKIGFKRYWIELEVKNMTAEQFILINRYTKTEADTIANLHYLMAVISYERRWWKKQPFDKDFEAKAELFRNKLTIDIAYSVSVFFCNLCRSWLQATQIYLVEKATEIKTKATKQLNELQKPSRRTGVGSQR